jgi:hypothetical protein
MTNDYSDYQEQRLKEFCEDNMGKEVLVKTGHNPSEYFAGVIQTGGTKGPIVKYSEGEYKGTYDVYYRLTEVKLRK